MIFEEGKNYYTALLFGGKGRERTVSLMSASNLISIAERENISLLPIEISEDGRYYLHGRGVELPESEESVIRSREQGDFLVRDGYSSFVTRDGEYRLSGVIPILHGDFGEDGVPQGFLESLGIPYFGTGVLGGALTTDKVSAKLYAEALCVPVLPFVLCVKSGGSSGCSRFAFSIDEAVRRSAESIGFPLFVKPSGLGSSIGAGKAYDENELYRAVERALEYSDRVLIERCLEEKRELECAFADFGGKRFITPPGEVLTRGFYDFDKKYGGETRVEISAKVPDGIKKQAIAYSDILTKVLGVRHLGRVDFFLSDDGNLYFNEINPIPGMTGESLYLKLLKKAGIGEGDFLRYAVRSLGGVSL